MQADVVLAGLFIAGLSCIVLTGVGLYVHSRRKRLSMKKSASMEELSSVDTSDPSQAPDDSNPVTVNYA
jgi:hypothetical protein